MLRPNKVMGKIKLFPTTEYSSKQPSDPVVPLVPCTGIFLGPSKSGKTVALILEQYRGVFEKIYIFSPSINIDDGWIPVKSAPANKHLGELRSAGQSAISLLLEAAQPARAGRRHRRAERPVAEGQAAQDLRAGDSGALQLPLRLLPQAKEAVR